MMQSMCFLTVEQPVSDKTPEAVWGIVCDNAGTILNQFGEGQEKQGEALNLLCPLWCLPLVVAMI